MTPPTRCDYRAKRMEFADGGLGAAAAVGTGCPAPTLADDDHAPFAPLLAGRAPVVLENGSAAAWCRVTEARVFTEGSAIVPLRWRDEPIGAPVIGESGEPYTRDDLELMEAIGEHAAGLIVTVQMSESRIRAREFEVFHRFASFVVHDLKNSITAPSTLSENAPKKIDDREFQRDALNTVAQTVTRRTSLLGRLREAPHGAAVDGSSPEGSGAALTVGLPFGGPFGG